MPVCLLWPTIITWLSKSVLSQLFRSLDPHQLRHCISNTEGCLLCSWKQAQCGTDSARSKGKVQLSLIISRIDTINGEILNARVTLGDVELIDFATS